MNAFHEISKDLMDMFKEINWRKLMTRLIIVLVLCSAVMGGCNYFNQKFGLDADNPLEEAIEDVIEFRTGIDIDLTPDSVE